MLKSQCIDRTRRKYAINRILGEVLNGHFIQGAPSSMDFTVVHGNNVHINLEPDTRAETDRLFAALSLAGAKADMPLQEMFWGDYFGSLTDQFGICWMFNCSSKT